MPELPEMQALAERLGAALGGSTLRRLTVIQFSALKTFDPPPEELVDRVVANVTRRGKYLILEFGGPRLLIHLSQAGRIDLEEQPKTTRPKGAVARLRFDDDTPSILVKEFGTQRRASLWVVSEGDEGPLAKLGPEPGSTEFEKLILSGSEARRLHTMLRDQRTIAGIGRGYADDALHRARLSPYAKLGSLDSESRRRLLDAVRSVLAEGLAHERKRKGGLPTKLGDHWIVHNRNGEPCPACGTDLRRVSFESHEITYCPTCQTNGKVLADRRLSRLLR